MRLLDISDIRKLTSLSPEEAMALLETCREGLSREEVQKRKEEFGSNAIEKASRINLVMLLVGQFTHFMAILLWVAGILAIIAGMPQLAYATWAVIFINAIFSFWQEYRADRALAKLADMIPRRIKTIREGRISMISADELTIGDVISLQAGDQIPADARLIQADGFFADVSLLTGESVAVNREAAACDLGGEPITESTNLVFAGTMVTEGDALAVVHAIGSNTELGRVSKLTGTIKRGQSALELQIRKIVRFITLVAIALGLAAFVIGVFSVQLDPRIGIIFAVGIIVANIPEGLLPAVSLSLAVGVQRMAGKNALIRRLSSVETLCSTSVICTDKTGTITENKLTVTKIWSKDNIVEIEGVGYEKAGAVTFEKDAPRDTLEMLLTAGTVCSEAEIRGDENDPDIWDIFGDPTEAAILIAAEKCGIDTRETKGRFERLVTIPFNSHRKMMSVVVGNGEDPRFSKGGRMVFTKGAPIEVIDSCRHIHAFGKVLDFTPEIKREIIEVNDRLAGEGFRVIAGAYELAENGETANDQNMIFLGLISMIDPPRPEVYEAVKNCREAGVRTTIITGDYGLTALAIGRQIGMITDKYTLHTGTELDALTDGALLDILRRDEPLIFSRANPEHKLRIVEAYKALGQIVAVTGDGVNDTLALKSAHIGIAMGKSGTDVAREVADMILLDDNFATIIMAIEEGRSIYYNIRKFMTYVLTSNIPEFMPYGAMVLSRIPPALNILQILAIDLGTDMVPALALGAEKPEQGILKEKPKRFEKDLLERNLFFRSYGYLGVIEGLLSLWVFLKVWANAGYSISELRGLTDAILNNTASPQVMEYYQYSTTMALAAIVACQIGNIFVCRSERLYFWQTLTKRNGLIFVGLAFEVTLSLLIIFTPFLSGVFGTAPLSFSDLKLLIICPVILVVMEELRKTLSNAVCRYRKARRVCLGGEK